MKREILLAAAILSSFASGASQAKADEDSGFSLARCRRYVSSPSTTYYVAPRPNVFNIQKTEVNVLSPITVAKAPTKFSHTPGPQGHGPLCGPDLTAGKTYTLKLSFLEDKTGEVVLYFGGTSHGCTVRCWAPNEVTFDVPNMGVAQPGTVAELRITRPDGMGYSRIVRLVNPPDLIEHEDPTPSSPAGQIGLLPPAGPMLNAVNGG